MFEQNVTSEALTGTTVTSQGQITQERLRGSVKASVKNYLGQRNGQEVTG
ncbi:Fis family transcriptional regulator, partial [Vibrio fluvialis]|nr:Fis family transcriptional regulator [Vibrio fluvialis]